jgi:hypothetical protein
VAVDVVGVEVTVELVAKSVDAEGCNGDAVVFVVALIVQLAGVVALIVELAVVELTVEFVVVELIVEFVDAVVSAWDAVEVIVEVIVEAEAEDVIVSSIDSSLLKKNCSTAFVDDGLVGLTTGRRLGFAFTAGFGSACTFVALASNSSNSPPFWKLESSRTS